ncbi:MAG: 30S ribosomal protein S18 [Oligoflexia bacterium]|nr:30S ribosomal protein S18 [Oligoflexia bacterium]MBF0366021.1 30S ribosomal protein S18 [Oligoflexia bacterium]
MGGDDDSEASGRGGKRPYDMDKDRRMFSRKKSCWFCAKESNPDWKDPHSYAWLVNEFGKISPGRISGLCATHQRHATTAIKRGRNMCLLSYISNHTAQ